MQQAMWRHAISLLLVGSITGCATNTLSPIPNGDRRVAVNVEETDQPLSVAELSSVVPASTAVAVVAPSVKEPISPVAPVITPVIPPVTLATVASPNANVATPSAKSTTVAAIEAAPVAFGLTPFTAESGGSLKSTLDNWLQANGWRLSWRAEGSSPGRIRDFRMSEPVSITPDSVAELLRQLLPGRGLHAIVSKKSKAVLIENDANALPRTQREE